jgi:lipopolysaccharide export system protein LptA
MRRLMITTLVLTTGLAGGLVAQGAQVPFGGLSQDTSLPVEITADQLGLDQAAGAATFTGNVRVGQGDLRLAADEVQVFYVSGGDATGTGTISELRAAGNVTLSNGTEAAEAARAVYDVAGGIVEMEGDVLLTQGGNALSGERLRLDLNAGTGEMTGRVRTIFSPGSGP